MATNPYPQNPPAIPPQAYQPYAQYQQTPPAPYGASSKRGNPLGLVAFIAGMLLVLWTFVSVGVQASLAGGEFGAYEVFGWVSAGIGVIFGLAAVVLGIISILLPDRPRVLGAIGLGIGILTIVDVIAYSALFPLLVEVL